MRISKQTVAVLRFFLETPDHPRFGAEISRATGIGVGTIYPLLTRLQNSGWIDIKSEQGDPTHLGRPLRFFYSLTPLGIIASRQAVINSQIKYQPLRFLDVLSDIENALWGDTGLIGHDYLLKFIDGSEIISIKDVLVEKMEDETRKSKRG